MTQKLSTLTKADLITLAKKENKSLKLNMKMLKSEMVALIEADTKKAPPQPAETSGKKKEPARRW